MDGIYKPAVEALLKALEPLEGNAMDIHESATSLLDALIQGQAVQPSYIANVIRAILQARRDLDALEMHVLSYLP